MTISLPINPGHMRPWRLLRSTCRCSSAIFISYFHMKKHSDSGASLEMTTLLEGDKWFSGLPPRLKQVLVERSRIQYFKKNEMIFRRGDSFDGIYCLLKGQVRFESDRPDQAFCILQILGPSQWFGELAFFDHNARSHNARCEE